MAADLDALFDARSVAVLGASNNPRKAAHQVIRTLLTEGYTGQVYPVHPTEKEVLGLGCYPSLEAIPHPVELLVVSVPAQAVLGILQQAARRGGVRGAVILSAGFAETGVSERVVLENEVARVARQAGIRIVGPNCLGLIHTKNRLCTGFAPGLKIREGGIGFITQSGALGGAFLMLAGDQPEPLGFSKFGHVGNMCDVSNLELLEYFGASPEITTIAMYLEGVRQGRAFIDLARKITRQKPIFILKVGRTELGSRATLSHTGALAGSDAIYSAAFHQGGAVRVETLEELLDASKAAAMLPRPAGRRLCVLTEAGGPGIIAVDEIARDGYLHLAPIAESTRQRLEQLLPPMAMICKPDGYIDMTAAAMEHEQSEALRLVLQDPSVDQVLLISLPPTFLPAIDVARKVAEVTRNSHKPVAVCMMRGEAMLEARRHLERHGIPTFDTPDRAARALVDFSRAAAHLADKPITSPADQETFSISGVSEKK